MRTIAAVMLVPASLLAACASNKDRLPAGTDLLGIYRNTYETGIFGFFCAPADDPSVDRQRERLHDQRLRIRERLIAQYGADPIERIELEAEERHHSVYFLYCPTEETRLARRRYGRMLDELERRSAASQ